MTTSTYDWRKEAAQTAMPDDAVEKAFFDQAATFISNKAAPLMRDPYRLGFEIVQKNDDNTRMVGIFAFRIGRDLYYAPAFFLNGEIKGTDLFYRHGTKTFVPLTEDWIKYLLEQDEQNIGYGQDRRERSKAPADMQLRRIAMPPATHTAGVKYASVGGEEVWVDPAFEKEGAIDWQAMLKEACEQKPLQPILKSFILEDGGWDAFSKIAAAIEASPVFAERLIAHCDVSDFAPEELLTLQKQAAVEPELVLYTGLHGDLDADQAKELFKRGYLIKDARKETTTIYEDTGLQLEGVSKPGVYEILDDSGEMVKAFCGNTAILEAYDYPIGYSGESRIGDAVRFVVAGKFGEGRVVGKPVLGDENDGSTIDDDCLKESMSNGIYVMFDQKTGALTTPFLVTGKSTKNGITSYDVVCHSYCGESVLRHNKDYDQESDMKIAGSGARFIKIKGTSENKGEQYTFSPERVRAGDDDILRNFLLSNDHIKSASVVYRDGDFMLRTGYKTCSQPMSRRAMAVGLSGDVYIKAAAVEEILDAAQARGVYKFLLEPPADKLANTIKLLGNPDFKTHSDADFGVEVETPQKYTIGTETPVEQPPEHRIGDAWDPGMGQGPMTDTPQRTEQIKAVNIQESSDDSGYAAKNAAQHSVPMDMLLNSSPQQLAEHSVQDNVPHMFEHGAVGSLVNTYDSAAMVDKYLPKMEQALDVAGRILFLFYWKPGDFQNLYGVDDMTNLENKLLSNFKSWGDMVLDLLKKTKTKQQGSVPNLA